MNKRIWLIYGEDEPPQGPYWSKRVSILARRAHDLGVEVSSIGIKQAEQRVFSKQDLFFYRITHRSIPRIALRERIEMLNGG